MASCEIECESDIGFYIWKIPSVSSIPHVVGYVVQSPSFSFGVTSWTLKMYPNGDSRENDGFTSLTIERLEARETVFCYLYYRNFFNNEIFLKRANLLNAEKKKSIPRLMDNLKEISQDSEIVTNDTLYLVIELCQICESISPTISSRETVGTTDGSESAVGEVFQEYEGCKEFIFIVSSIPRGLPSDYVIESPQYSFFNAKWILKVKPHYRMESSEKASSDIVLERLESQVPVHHVRLIIHLFYPDDANKEEYWTFDSGRVQSPAFEFQLKELNERNLGFKIEIRQFISSRICIDPEKESAEKSPVDDTRATFSMMNLKCKALQDYQNMFFAKEDCDVTFKVKGQEIRAHRLILKFRSPTFRNEMKDNITDLVEIKDCEPNHFSDFLHFLYCGEVENLTPENVFSLFTLAVKFDVPDLKNVCMEFINRKLNKDTVIDTILLA